MKSYFCPEVHEKGEKAIKKQDQHVLRLYGDYILRREIDVKIFITTLLFNSYFDKC